MLTPRTDRPYLLLGGAINARGNIAGEISTADDWRRVHHIRERVDAIAVGAGTFRIDRPRLIPREEHLGRPPFSEPWRVVFAGHGRIDGDRLGGKGLLVVGEQPPARAVAWLPAPPRELLPGLQALHRLGIHSILLEGGPTVWRAALAERVVDDLEMYVATRDADVARRNVATLLNLQGHALQACPFTSGHLVTAAFNPAQLGHHHEGAA